MHPYRESSDTEKGSLAEDVAIAILPLLASRNRNSRNECIPWMNVSSINLSKSPVSIKIFQTLFQVVNVLDEETVC